MEKYIVKLKKKKVKPVRCDPEGSRQPESQQLEGTQGAPRMHAIALNSSISFPLL